MLMLKLSVHMLTALSWGLRLLLRLAARYHDLKNALRVKRRVLDP